MKISILCNDGSPLGITCKTLHGDDPVQPGVGGAELYLLTLCEAFQMNGHDIVLYNDPREPNASPFPQLPISKFDPDENRDALIIFRSPNERAKGAKGKKIWLSCDQFTISDFKQFSKQVHEIVCISPFHAKYFGDKYEIYNAKVIDIPVRTWEYNDKIEKVPYRCLYASVPSRGLDVLLTVWPEIVRKVPQANLVVTSDFRLWGCHDAGNAQFIQRAMHTKNVTILGAVRRERLIEEQMKAQILTYPSTYEELFCIAVAEAEVAGALPITSSIGAVKTTNMYLSLPGSAKSPEFQRMFVDNVCEMLTSPSLTATQEELMKKARERFDIRRIMEQWNSVLTG